MNDIDADKPEVPFEISVEEVKQLLEREAELLLIDCRRPDEYELASIPQAQLIPMSEFPDRVSELADAKAKRVIVHCHHGGRSQRVTAWLREQGFAQAQNMTGGIDAWSERIDPQVPRY